MELSEFYSGDLNTGDFTEETRHLASVGMPLFGKVSSLEFLNKIYQKGLQNIFP